MIVEELVEIERDMTVEESALQSISNDCSYNKSYTDVIKARLKEIGYIERTRNFNGSEPNVPERGRFAILSQREATAQEIQAFGFVNLAEFVDFNCNKCVFQQVCKSLEDCIFDDDHYDTCLKLIKGLKVVKSTE